jgi:hypothetical protein
MKKQITRDDLIPTDQYAVERRARRKAIAEIKSARRLDVGPSCSFYFENYDTMLFQVLEMLHIEKGGEEQIEGELGAYNPLVPNGRELVATVMIEIADPDRRAELLGKLGGFEETITLTVGDSTVQGRPEEDADRTNTAGKASSVQFIHFALTDQQAVEFQRSGADITVSIGHSEYRHMAGVSETMRQSLAADLD